MANPIKGEVPLKLSDGREFVLVFGPTAMAVAEDVSGKPLPEIGAAAEKGFFGALLALFYGMLKARHPSMTYDEAGQIAIDYPDEIRAALDRAAERGLPDQEPEGKKGANPRSKNSGHSGSKKG